MALSATRKAQRRLNRAAAAAVAIQQKQAERLVEWKREAERRSRSLDGDDLVWGLYREEVGEARRLGLEAELRDVCFVAAGFACDPRTIRVTRCHRRGRE